MLKDSKSLGCPFINQREYSNPAITRMEEAVRYNDVSTKELCGAVKEDKATAVTQDCSDNHFVHVLTSVFIVEVDPVGCFSWSVG